MEDKKICNKYKTKITDDFENYIESLRERTSDYENFPDINELEMLLISAQNNNKKIIKNFTSEFIDNIDEDILIKLKKRI